MSDAHFYEAVRARDARFDGTFFVGVSTTGVYCRPICRVRTPGRDRCSYYPSAAAAEAAGYRPCLRCRPELAPSASPPAGAERLALAAWSRIDAGALNDASVAQLASELGVSARQLQRVVEGQYGVGPLGLARTRRLLLAKQLLADTSLPIARVAFASGFSSLRQFNRSFREHYRLEPSAVRRANGEGRRSSAEDGFVLRLGYRPPLAWRALIEFLAGRSGGRTERVDGARYARTVRIGAARGYIEAEPVGPAALSVRISPELSGALPELRVRLRRLFDLDANPAVVDALLEAQGSLRRHVAATRGLRVPGAFQGFELALRAVLGQQITVKAATTVYGRFVEHFGEPCETPLSGLDRLAPDAERVAGASLQQLIDRGLTRRRAETVQLLARAVADGQLRLDPPSDIQQARAALLSLPGIGPWTTEYIAMRALGDPDAFPHSDLGLVQAARVENPRQLLTRAEAWRPYRAYGALHLWHGHAQGG